ncbi:PilW family protein [Noviherbaspirillum malthae]|uniref:PilW family protein n=1 Tax=Noviherbaspirillum malthae TaxID=1260987 RepID=UPI001E52446A|nr:PilW family protein [Noviherbaspirillum malthae]
MSAGSSSRTWRPGPLHGYPGSAGQKGLTLIELMISLTLGLLIVIAATSAFLSSKNAYTAGDDATHIDDTGRFALEIIARSLRQAAYVDWDRNESPAVVKPGMSPSIEGLDARSLKASTTGMTSPQTQSVNGSDTLSVQFFGAADGTMLNCAGFPVAGGQRGSSIFYVATDGTGEPQLYCKYSGDDGWSSDAIARGIEAFHVLYGLDTDNDGISNRLLNAAAINALDDAAVGAGESAVRNAKTHWKKVVAVNVALLVRGSANADPGGNAASDVYDLFGKEYSEQHGAGDQGVRLSKEDLPASTRNRLRKVFSTTIQLRNAADGAD